MNNDVIVRTENLTKTYRKTTAIKDVNIEIRQGQVYGFLGPNGSGKTTTIGLMLGLIRPTKGKIYLFNEELKAESLERVRPVMDCFGFYPRYSGRDNLLTFGSLHKPVDKNRVEEVLDFVGLKDRAKSKFRTYSHGMKQRLSVALALLEDPELLIFDEPTNGMDPEGIALIRNLIVKLAQEGKTILLASHLLAEVEQVCTHIAIMKKGVVIRHGDMNKLAAENGSDELEIITSDSERATPILFNAGYNPSIENGKIVVPATQEQAQQILLLLLNSGISIKEMKHRKSSLESIFLDATK